MADIKTREKEKYNIRKFDRATIIGKNLKENIVKVKEKTKENYEKDEGSEKEYAENKINNVMKDTTYYMPKFNEEGKKNLKITKENIEKGKEQIKRIKTSVKNIKLKEKNTKKVINKNMKKLPNKIKYSPNIMKVNRNVAKSKQKIIKNLKRNKQIAKKTANVSAKTVKASIKVTKTMIKSAIAGTKALISALIAGGWIAVVIVIIICFIGILCSSIFGIFFSNEKSVGNKTMGTIIRELNSEYTNKIVEIQKNNNYDEYEIVSKRAEWKDIISVYAVIESKGKEQADIITIDERKANQLKEIFWKMNIINYKIEEIEQDVETKDDNGNVKNEKKFVRKLFIETANKTLQEMIEMYKLNEKQIEQIAELQDNKYDSVWRYLFAGSSTGCNDIVEVAKQYIGNVGGQIFWKWYGFETRVEWCACFVSFCANECGYIEQGIIPKFASCESEGVAWFKACNLWQEREYIAEAGDIIFFDWECDGKVDHVGIVEKVENNTVYTIEGNSNDSCKEKEYDVCSKNIAGYGIPRYLEK